MTLASNRALAALARGGSGSGARQRDRRGQRRRRRERRGARRCLCTAAGRRALQSERSVGSVRRSCSSARADAESAARGLFGSDAAEPGDRAHRGERHEQAWIGQGAPALADAVRGALCVGGAKGLFGLRAEDLVATDEGGRQALEPGVLQDASLTLDALRSGFRGEAALKAPRYRASALQPPRARCRARVTAPSKRMSLIGSPFPCSSAHT